jgi:hypothetical protein
VDRLLDDILGSTEEVNHLIAFTAEDAEIVAQVGSKRIFSFPNLL